MSITPIHTIVTEIENKIGSNLVRLSGKQIVYTGKTQNDEFFALITPQSKIHANGFGWVDMTLKQISLLSEYDIGIIAFRLENGLDYYVNYNSLKEYLTDDNMKYSAQALDHWKFYVNPKTSELKIQGSNDTVTLTSEYTYKPHTNNIGLQKIWLKYNDYANKIADALGRTSNIVGEYAEKIANDYYKGTLLAISEASADIKADDGTLYQVKARKIKGTSSTQLGIIRSWNFDYLVVVLFNSDGSVMRALEVPVDVAKEYAVDNNNQNGGIITTSQSFLNDARSKDITNFL